MDQIASPTRASICAVVVTFHPDEDFPQRLEQLSRQVARVIVVDNTDRSGAAHSVPRRTNDRKIEWCESGQNVGVASALNRGIRRAGQQSFHWVVTLDQDTVPNERMIEILCNAFAAHPHPERIGVIGSTYPQMRSADKAGDTLVTERTVITAGSLISMTAFEAVGGFREDLFIDGVDEDFCLRVRRNGFDVIRATEIGIHQPIGSQTRRRFLWREIGVSNHPVFRHYYMARNRWILIANHFAFDPGWASSQILTQVKMIAFVLFFETDKRAKLGAMIKGFAHAISGKRGKLDKQ